LEQQVIQIEFTLVTLLQQHTSLEKNVDFKKESINLKEFIMTAV